MSVGEAPQDLLIEIGTEELPPKALARLEATLAAEILQGLDKAQLEHGGLRSFATPRRLAVRVASVAAHQPERRVERKGPAVQAAFDAQGRPTKAALGFARACGAEVEALERLETDKGEWLLYRAAEPGRPAIELLPGIVSEALAALPIPKKMRWGAGDVEFARPVHWAVVLYGRVVVQAGVLGVHAGRETRGHRFHCPRPIVLDSPQDYAERLRHPGYVIADRTERAQRIRKQVEACAASVGGRAVIDADLLEEVTALVEWPVALVGHFDTRFLQVPPEVLTTTMQDHQKYFPVVDAQGGLLPHFIAVANIESRDPERVREGNERVIRPRFQDAEFFWSQDRKTPLIARRPKLAEVVFQEKLGSLLDKSDRLVALGADIAGLLDTHPELARRAGELAKCDLLTNMVTEFPALQGIMGRYYALHDGEPEEVAWALEEQYRPKGAGAPLPAHDTGRVLALADRLDTLVGIFAAGIRPTGLKDPFGLRRAALGVLRILIEARLDLDLWQLLEAAARRLPGTLHARDLVPEVFDFCLERLRAYYADQGIPSDSFEAVAARRPTRPLDFDRRVRAVEAFRRLPEAQALAAANKRIRNILKKVEARERVTGVSPEVFTEPGERALWEAIEAAKAAVAPLFAAGHYTQGLERLAALRGAVDRFFDEVLVMADDPTVRRNRIALLASLAELFLQVADVSRLQSGPR